MVSLVGGLFLIAAAWLMLRLAPPRPDGRPARFLEASGFTVAYAVAFTAAFSLGAMLVLTGLGGLIL